MTPHYQHNKKGLTRHLVRRKLNADPEEGSWRQGRKHGSLLKKLGIQLENEKSIRELLKEIVSDFVKVQKRLFAQEEMSQYEVPCGRVADLPRSLDRLLDSYDEQSLPDLA